MSIRGFEVGGVTQQYDYNYLDNIPNASDLGAIPAPSSPSDGDVLTYDESLGAWVARESGGGGGGGGGGGTGLTDEIKAALLACFRNVAWITADGQELYDALEDALEDADA